MSGSSNGVQYVLFKIAEEVYGVEISVAQEVLRYIEPRKIPHAPAHVLGMVNVRGQIIPLVSLRAKFSLPPDSVTDATRIVVVRHAEKLTGILCDSVERVAMIADGNIELNPDFSNNATQHSIRGVAHMEGDDRIIFLLSMVALLEETNVSKKP